MGFRGECFHPCHPCHPCHPWFLLRFIPYANGVPSFSPGLRGTSYPGSAAANIPTRNAVAAHSFSRRPRMDSATTSLRLFRIHPVHPREALQHRANPCMSGIVYGTGSESCQESRTAARAATRAAVMWVATANPCIRPQGRDAQPSMMAPTSVAPNSNS